MKFKGIINEGMRFVKENQSTILTALGVAGLVSTGVLTAQATVKAVRRIDKIDPNMALRERFLLTWRLYIPPVAMGAISAACIIGAHSTDMKKNAALAGLYTLTEETLQDYRKKVVEKIGEKKEEEVYGDAVQERIKRKPIESAEVIMTGKGETLCFESYSGRYFKSDIETLRRIQNDLNHDLLGQMWVPLNDLYYVIGLEPTKMGDEIGWTTDELIEMKFNAGLTPDGTPCLVIDLNAQPLSKKTF